MVHNILTPTQTTFLELVGAELSLSEKFYLTGGTALAGFYIPYRYSEDLDFFSETEIDILTIQTFIKSIGQGLGVKQSEYQTSFNRNLFFLTLANNTVLKTEFTYFPFTQIEKPQKHNGVRVDSAIDIATNKLFTIYQRTAARDYIDLYKLCTTYQYTIPDLITKARIKFDTHIDLLKLGTQFNKASQALDLPRLIESVSPEQWHAFFADESKKLESQILE